MNSESGVCPSCRDEGEIAAPCPERGCRARGYHFIPRAYATEPRLDAEIGLLLEGRYLLVSRLGEGGFGKVFVALDRTLDTKVALKLLKTVDDPQAHDKRTRLIEVEAKILARLSHPNIVQMKGFGFFEGAPYIVLEYIEGGKTLAREISRRAKENQPLAFSELDAILSGVLFGLEEAHNLQIVHRDIKPDNIMLQAKPGHPVLPRILDFGIAKLADTTSQSSSITGTPDYMAPEQISRGEIGPWTDLYALGVMAFELMTGRRPFHGDFVAILSAKCDPDFDPLEAVADLRLSAVVRGFLRKALALRPEQRFRTAPEFRTALQSALATYGSNKISVDLTALVTSERILARAPVRARRSGLGLGIAFLAAAAAGGLGVWLATRNDGGPRPPEPTLAALPDVMTREPSTTPPETLDTKVAANPTLDTTPIEPAEVATIDTCATDCITALQGAFGLRFYCDPICRGPNPPGDADGFQAATSAALRAAPVSLSIGPGRTARARWDGFVLQLEDEVDLGAYAIWERDQRNAKLARGTRIAECERKSLYDWARDLGASDSLWACLRLSPNEGHGADWPVRTLTIVDGINRSEARIAIDPESALGQGPKTP